MPPQAKVIVFTPVAVPSRHTSAFWCAKTPTVTTPGHWLTVDSKAVWQRFDDVAFEPQRLSHRQLVPRDRGQVGRGAAQPGSVLVARQLNAFRRVVDEGSLHAATITPAVL